MAADFECGWGGVCLLGKTMLGMGALRAAMYTPSDTLDVNAGAWARYAR